jgi:hypothetical protein
MSRPSHARRVVMVADQPLDPVDEGGVVAGEPIGVVGGQGNGHLAPADLDIRMVVCASTASTTRLTNRIADRKSWWTKVLAMTSPVRCQPGSSCRVWVTAALSRMLLLRSSLPPP